METSLRITLREVIFFIIVFVLFQILSGYEYHLYERMGELPTWAFVFEQIVTTLRHTAPYLLYYVWVLPFLFRKKYWSFAWRLVVFLFMLNVYIHYFYWLMMNMRFLPALVVDSYSRWFRATLPIHFSTIYVLRELLIVSGFGYFVYASRQEKQLSVLQKHQLQAELDLLKIQMQPHFFFNTLNNIYALALQNSSKTAPLVAKHADVMRYILYKTTDRTVHLAEEVAFLENYVVVESVRFSENIQIRFEKQGDLSSVRIEPLLLLPFIENIFKHGLRHEVEHGDAHILVVLIGAELILQAENSKAFGNTHSLSTSGMGLATAQKRLALLYAHKHQLTIRNEETRYSVELRLTLAQS